MPEKPTVPETNQSLKTTKKAEIAPSERFAKLVIREYESMVSVGSQMTETQRRLVKNYFIATDRVLQGAEQRRLAKSEKYRDVLPVTWQNVDMTAFALDCVHYSRLGLDPLQKNHLHIIPYKNNKTKKYDMTLMEGYEGKELKAKKYALDIPKAIDCELVYSNDTFTLLKKGATNKVESYEFEINDPFDRGKIKGGFGYIQYDQPEKNRVIVLSMKDILKRKNSGAGNVEFWGGEKDKWENGKKTGKVAVEGWQDEMMLKTVKRHVFGQIAIDPSKIDDTYNYTEKREIEYAQAFAQDEIDQKANNGVMIDADFAEVEDTRQLPQADENGEVVEDLESAGF